MLNVLLITKDINLYKNMINYTKDINFSLHKSFFDSYVKFEKTFDVIIIDIKLTKKNIDDIINLYSNNTNDILISFHNRFLFYNVENRITFYTNEEQLIEFLNNRQFIRYQILKEMKSLEFEMRNIGDFLIFESIYLLKCSNVINLNFEKYLYPLVAKKYNIPVSNVKWNIIYSVNKLYKYNREIIKKYFNRSFKYKITPKNIILGILERINY